ncbi:hypothetical protein FA13DRAFT_1819766 [Coprinellus micaceus]|uniref:Uncharacterized protein n=1 Tax=Coprinellus micaceus TaxID=71717 RepID=A0A4Y7SGZ1_COPMI|nr:hypothetical protein FA13DRAFT_1819766 [Coprinellus micaceus]
MARFLTLHHLPPDDDLHTPLGFVNMLHGIDRVMKREDELYQVDSGRVFSVSRRFPLRSQTSLIP